MPVTKIDHEYAPKPKLKCGYRLIEPHTGKHKCHQPQLGPHGKRMAAKKFELRERELLKVPNFICESRILCHVTL
jgi:hypothetical protein